MKKIFTLVLLVFLGTGWGFSQSIQLIMSPRPSPYFSDWQNKTETIRMIVNNTSKAAIDCKINTQLFNSKEEMVGETDFNKMPVLSLQPGISQFNAEDIYPLDAIKLFGNSLSSMLKTGRIPEDNYRLCTDLLDPVKGTPLTQSPQCKIFSIIAFQAPVLLTPREDEIIPETGIRAVMFRWTPVTPSSNVLVTYRFQVWEVLDGQTMADACRYNQPIVEKDFRGILQTQWPVDFALPGIAAAGAAAAGGFSIQKYVWSITPYDDQDRKLVIDGYGMAEPFGFSVSVIHKGAGGWSNSVTGNTTNTPLDRIVVDLSMGSSGSSRTNQLRLEDLNIQLTNNAKEPIDVSLRGTVTLKSNADMPTKFTDYTLDGASKSVTITSNADMPTKAAPKPVRFGLILGFGFKPFTLPTGTTTFTYDDIKKGDLKFSSDEWAKAFGPGGIIPPGDYDICVSVLDKTGKEIGKGCMNQKITGPYVPDTLAQKINGAYVPDTTYEPTDGHIFSETDIKKPVTFRWIPVIPKPKDPVTYRLRVWQLMQGQTGAKAMEINQPLITKDVDNLTQIVIESLGGGPCLPPYLCDFVWNVQALNKEGKLIGESLPSPKGWFGFRIEEHLGTTMTTNEACKDFSVVLMDYRKIWKGDSAFVEASITNKYRGDDPKNKPRSFGIKIQNGLVVEFADNVIKGWTRTPSKFPPGSSSIKWINNSGDIPNGETKFGNIRFANANTGPISIQYEWLNKDDKVLCSGTIDLAGSPDTTADGHTKRSLTRNWIADDTTSTKTIGRTWLASDTTSTIHARKNQSITLVSPTNDQPAKSVRPIFEWKNENQVKGLSYSIKIVEIKGDQSPDEAMQKNQAFFEQKNIDGTKFKYPESAPKFKPGKKYAWGVKYGNLLSEYRIFDRWGN